MSRAAGVPDRVQRRTMGALAASQVWGGVGSFAAIAVATLLAKAMVGSDSVAGLPQTSRELGAAAAAFGIARISTARGRRIGLVCGYLVCAVGSAVCVLAGAWSSFSLLTVGMIMVGAGLASSWQARFAATDLARPHQRARALSVVVWTTTVGAVAGPGLAGPAGDAVTRLGLPRLTGGFLVGALGAVVAAVWVGIRMRPDPLLVARHLNRAATPSVPAWRWRSLGALVRAHPPAIAGITAIGAAHATMLAVMVIAPLQMGQHAVGLSMIGVVIAAHIAGMYGLAPVLGWCTDTVGARPVLLAGTGLMVAGVLLADSAGDTAGGSLVWFTTGLCLVGLGWSCILVAASAVVTAALPISERPAAQGFSDLVMGIAGGAAGALAGLIVGTWGFHALTGVETVMVCVAGAAALTIRGPQRSLTQR